jgi:hypothetical protein
MHCSVPIKLVGQISSLTSKPTRQRADRASRLPQTKSDKR